MARAAIAAFVSSLGLIAGCCVVIVAGAALFIPFSGIDLWSSALFYDPDRGFIGRGGAIEWVRHAFVAVFFSALALGLAGTYVSARGTGSWLGISKLKWIFLVLSLSIGPGLVANVMLKDEMGRARPRQIEMFGGTKMFTPALVKSSECRRNCSFVSGEASSIFALLFALGFIFPAHLRRLIAIGVVTGGIVGLIRMSQGGHFLSDVVFAGAFMGITVGLLHSLMFELPQMLSNRGAMLPWRGRA